MLYQCLLQGLNLESPKVGAAAKACGDTCSIRNINLYILHAYSRIGKPSRMVILTIERMATRKSLSKEIYTLIDTLRGRRFIFKTCIYAISKEVHLSAVSVL